MLVAGTLTACAASGTREQRGAMAPKNYTLLERNPRLTGTPLVIGRFDAKDDKPDDELNFLRCADEAAKYRAAHRDAEVLRALDTTADQ